MTYWNSKWMLIEVAIGVGQWGECCSQGLYDPAKVNTNWPPLWLLITATALSFLSPWSLTHSSLQMFPPELTGSAVCADGWGKWIVKEVVTLFPWQKQRDCRKGNIISTWFRRERGGAGIAVEVFPNCPALFGCLIIRTFLRVISVCLVKTHIYSDARNQRSFTLVTSSHALLKQQHFSKLRPPSVVSSNRWQISPVYKVGEWFKINYYCPVQPGGPPHVIIQPLFSTNGPRLCKYGATKGWERLGGSKGQLVPCFNDSTLI